jgi:vanillate O-demethylase monooxygenase subunit
MSASAAALTASPPGWFGNDHPALRACWHPVARSGEVGASPVAVTLFGERWVLARLGGPDGPVTAGDEAGGTLTAGDGAGGTLAALRDRCPHRLAPLSAGAVADGAFECAYHGWRFAADGRCVRIPALGPGVPAAARTAAATAAAGVAERYGLVWLALEPPIVPPPEVAEWGAPRLAEVTIPDTVWRAGAAQMTDNFLDVAHFPFTHGATIGDPDDRVVGPFSVQRRGWSFTAVFEHSSRSLLGDVADARPLDARRMELTAWAPHHLRLRLDYPTDATTIVLLFFAQPIDATTTRLFTLELADNVADGRVDAAAAAAFQLAVATEDRELLERLETKAVPLDLTVERHTRADRGTVELRRLLRDLARAHEEGS